MGPQSLVVGRSRPVLAGPTSVSPQTVRHTVVSSTSGLRPRIRLTGVGQRERGGQTGPLRRRHLHPYPAAVPSNRDASEINASAESERGGQGGAAPSGSPSDANGAASDQPRTNSTWARLLLALPLELSAAAAKTNDHYLAKRKKRHWWSHAFPKVPGDDLARIDAELQEPVTIWGKLLPLGLIFFCASFNLTILQNLKDALIVTTAGAEALPFLASVGVLPATIGFFMYYGGLVQRLQKNTIFYAAILPLVVFYAFFAAVLYPASAVLHPHGFYGAVAPMVPTGIHGLLKVVEHWTFSIFFCVAELWGSVVISVLFWTLANELCSVTDAKTIYPLMGISANMALVVAGNYVKWINRVVAQGSLGSSLQILVATVVGVTGIMMATKAYVDRAIPRPEPSERKSKDKKGKKGKKKGSIGESFAVLRGSPMISNLALLVVGYGLTHRLFEFCWKGQLRLLYPSAQAYQGMLADVAIWTGYATMALMLTGRFVFEYLGWKVAALATPTVMLVSGAAFFGLSIAASAGGSTLAVGTLNLASLGALAGAVTQVFARASKFSLFDPAKEMVYIEMSAEEKAQGKAAVDLLGSQVGKSGASWATQALLLVLGSIRAAMPLVTAVYVAVIAAWIVAVGRLGRQMEEHDKQDAAEEAAAAALRGARSLELNGTPINGMHNPTVLPSSALHHSRSAGPAALGGATPIVIDGDVNGAFENNQNKQSYNGGHISASNGNANHRTDVPNFASNLAMQ